MRAPNPPNEAERLDALRSFEVLDTETEQMFDDLVMVASTICGTPIAAVSLVDENRQWFKSWLGTSAREMPRDDSFCAHAILEPTDLFIVADTQLDPRFLDNNLVLKDPYIRFYAGMPMVDSDGMALGTLCVIDRRPRQLTDDQKDCLRALGRQAAIQMEYRRSLITAERATIELEEKRRDAMQSSSAKEAFIATISHELRTPMNGVIGVAQMLRSTGLTVQQARLVDTMEECASSLMVVLNDIIEFSNTESGRISLQSNAFQPVELVKELVRLFQPIAKAKDLLVEASGSLSETLHGDVVRIRQALNALIDNAVKYSDSGVIQVEAKEVGRSTSVVMVRFTVRDNGVGIPKDRQRVVLESFRQGETGYTRTYSGVGLGLSTCRSLVERMGGRFDFESKVGEGSTFWFEIPLTQEEVEIVPITPEPEKGKSLNGCKILVAEDNMVNALVLTAMLERFGCIVRAVMNGKEAVEALQGEKFDVVLMDLQMPVMDGIRATEEVRHMSSDASKVPVIAITASTQESDRQACARVGMNDFICKPINEEIVFGALTRWISA
jgi:two-component system, sensor histidine kinase